ncbi:MAG: hypothetical protein H6799_03515 [Candidatus Nomurabacteria bacterium]|mgnify:CR=1 FL=1|nr:MAG: hypothetical protein H6799_03515 [Candidatus Nomurabacteria bacterium]HRV76050.1 hypothetical protein [Candidatus Saccharimonadales bacterium]
MKKILTHISLVLFSLIFSLGFLSNPKNTYATQQTVILKPTKAELGVVKIYPFGSSAPSSIYSNGGTDLANSLSEDGQFALLDPSISGPIGSPGTNSIVMLDYQKDVICLGSQIEQVVVHAIWKSDIEQTQPTSAAILVTTEDYQGYPSFDIKMSEDSSQASLDSNAFGGLVNPAALNIEGASFSGLLSNELTESSSPVQIIPSQSQLSNPLTKIAISMGETEPEVVTGLLDYAYLEVTYDDANCSPEGIGISTVKPPKTGSVLTVGIIIAASITAIGTSIFGVKKTKLKHRITERE